MGIETLLLLIIPPLIISTLVIFAIEKVYLNIKSSKNLYFILMISWMALFVVSFYMIFAYARHDSLLSLLIYIMCFLIITAPLGLLIPILIYILHFSLRYSLNREIFNNMFFYSFLVTSLFLLGYYQWFIWFPKYLKRKTLKEGDK